MIETEKTQQIFLPTEIIRHIAQFADTESVLAFSKTSRELGLSLENDLQSKTVIKKIFANGETTLILMQDGAVYINLYSLSENTYDKNFYKVNLGNARCKDITADNSGIFFVTEKGQVLISVIDDSSLFNDDKILSEPIPVDFLNGLTITKIVAKYDATLFITSDHQVYTFRAPSSDDDLTINDDAPKKPTLITALTEYKVIDAIIHNQETGIFFITDKGEFLQLINDQLNEIINFNGIYDKSPTSEVKLDIISTAHSQNGFFFVVKECASQTTRVFKYRNADAVGSQVHEITVLRDKKIISVAAQEGYELFFSREDGKLYLSGKIFTRKNQDFLSVIYKHFNSKPPTQIQHLDSYNITAFACAITAQKALDHAKDRTNFGSYLLGFTLKAYANNTPDNNETGVEVNDLDYDADTYPTSSISSENEIEDDNIGLGYNANSYLTNNLLRYDEIGDDNIDLSYHEIGDDDDLSYREIGDDDIEVDSKSNDFYRHRWVIATDDNQLISFESKNDPLQKAFITENDFCTRELIIPDIQKINPRLKTIDFTKIQQNHDGIKLSDSGYSIFANTSASNKNPSNTMHSDDEPENEKQITSSYNPW